MHHCLLSWTRYGPASQCQGGGDDLCETHDEGGNEGLVRDKDPGVAMSSIIFISSIVRLTFNLAHADAHSTGLEAKTLEYWAPPHESIYHGGGITLDIKN